MHSPVAFCAYQVPSHFSISEDPPLIYSVYFVGDWQFFGICFSNLAWIYIGGRQWAPHKLFWVMDLFENLMKAVNSQKMHPCSYFACKFQIATKPVSPFPMDSITLSFFMSPFKQHVCAPCQTGTAPDRPWDLTKDISTLWCPFSHQPWMPAEVTPSRLPLKQALKKAFILFYEIKEMLPFKH